MPHVLNLMIWLPILGGFFILFCCNDKKPLLAKNLALSTVVITLGISAYLLINFDIKSSSMQFVEHIPWLPLFGINEELGVDGLSLLLIVLSVITNLIAILATWNSIQYKVPQYLAAFLLMQGFLVGVFASLDVIVFYIFWEATLIPMYLLIGIWGSEDRVYAAIKFFLYTFLGSVLMLVAFLYLGNLAGTYSLQSIYTVKLSMHAQVLILIAFFFGFAIKVPMFPVHTWLPDAHTQAPAGGSIVLAAILLKLGAYGFLRFALPIVPDACRYYANVIIALSLIAVVYIGVIALIQKDMKKLVAYSSISHMGFVTLATFAIFNILNTTATNQYAGLILEGAIVIMISHAFVSGALFAGIGFIYDRLHTRQIKDFGGIVHTMPIFAAFFMLFAMANAGLPGTSGFVGEWMVILGSIKANFWFGFWAATTLIIGAAYTLWMYKRVIYGPIINEPIKKLQDLCCHEIIAYTILAFFVLAMGIFPKPIIDFMHPAVNNILNYAAISKFNVE